MFYLSTVSVSLADIFNFTTGQRPIKEGEAVFKAGFVILCGLDVANPSIVKALCLRTAGITLPPHEIQIKFDGITPNTWHAVCSCKAGNSGACKHVLATLIHINRFPDLEQVSCTDLKQKWGQEKKGVEAELETVPIVKFNSIGPKKNPLPPATAGQKKNFFDMIVTGCSNSALSLFHQGSQQNIAEEEAASLWERDEFINIFKESMKRNLFLENAKKEFNFEEKENSLNVCCQKIIKKLNASRFEDTVNLDQGSRNWQIARQLRITGSTCYEIYTYSGENWEKKGMNLFFPKGFTNKYTIHGKKYEEEARNEYGKLYTQYKIITVGFIISDMFPWLGTSPDGIIFENKKPKKLLEIKCPYMGREHNIPDLLKKLDYLESVANEFRLKKSHKYYGQIQLSMAILNLNETDFIIYSSSGRNFFKLTIPFDQAFASKLIQKISEQYFYNLLHVYCTNNNNT